MNELMNSNSLLIISIGTSIYVHNQVDEKYKIQTDATYQYKRKVQQNIHLVTILFYYILGKVIRK